MKRVRMGMGATAKYLVEKHGYEWVPKVESLGAPLTAGLADAPAETIAVHQ